MQQINELTAILKQSFNWNKARIDCVAGMLVGLLKTRSMSLTEIATGFPSDATLESRYRRIQRFIHDYPIDFDAVAWFIVMLFVFLDGRYYLAIDRSNWKWGKKTSIF